MPQTSGVIPVARRAANSSYMYNCGLNALTHVLVENMDNVDIPLPAKQELLQKFDALYGTNLHTDANGWDRLTQQLRGLQNPIHREIVLGPVLRQMSNVDLLLEEGESGWEGLYDTEIMFIANKFGIEVSSYITYEAFKNKLLKAKREELGVERLTLAQEAELNVDYAAILANPAHEQHPDNNQLEGENVLAGARVATLDLLNTGNHYERGVTEAAAGVHNTHYTNNRQWGRYRYNYRRDGASIARAIGTAVTTNQDLNTTFQQYETNHLQQEAQAVVNAAASNATAAPNGLQQMANMLQALTGATSPENKFINGIFGFLGPLLNFLFGFMGKLKGFVKQINPGAELDEEDLTKYARPEEASLYSEYVQKVGATDESSASFLNKTWRQDSSFEKDVAWTALTNRLLEAGLAKDLNNMLKRRERIVQSGILTSLQFGDSHEAYHQYLTQNANPFGEASPEYQEANAQMRSEMLKEIYSAARLFKVEQDRILATNAPGAAASIEAEKVRFDEALAQRLHALWIENQASRNLEHAANERRAAAEAEGGRHAPAPGPDGDGAPAPGDDDDHDDGHGHAHAHGHAHPVPPPVPAGGGHGHPAPPAPADEGDDGHPAPVPGGVPPVPGLRPVPHRDARRPAAVDDERPEGAPAPAPHRRDRPEPSAAAQAAIRRAEEARRRVAAGRAAGAAAAARPAPFPAHGMHASASASVAAAARSVPAPAPVPAEHDGDPDRISAAWLD